MIKERVKSIILVILVIFTLVLAERILVDKKLWPEGYNFFSIGKKQKDNSVSASDNLILPDRIIINTGDQTSRFEYLRTAKDFEEIYSSATDVLKTAFESPSKNVVQVSSDAWYSALTGRSVYLSYPVNFSAKSFSGLLGVDRTEAPFNSFCDIVIDDNGSVIIDDNGTFYKIETLRNSMSEIIDSAADGSKDSQSVINYSFDLNFDKEFGSQKTILSPMIPIYSDAVEANVIVSENPLKENYAMDRDNIDAILAAFSVNPNSIWQYTEADGTVVFVENNGILKISPAGVLTWTATETGLALSGQSSAPHETAAAVANFIDTVNSAIGHDTHMSLASSLTNDSNEYFAFNYNINGMPIRYLDANAVAVTVKDGYITEYSHILRVYSPAEEKAFSPLYFEALDRIIANHQDTEQINIKKMYPAYIDDLSIGKKYPDWYIEIENEDK